MIVNNIIEQLFYSHYINIVSNITLKYNVTNFKFGYNVIKITQIPDGRWIYKTKFHNNIQILVAKIFSRGQRKHL